MNYTEYIELLDRNLKSNAVISEKDCVFYDIREKDEFDIYGLVDPKNTNEFHRVPLNVCDEIGAGMQYFGRNTAGGRIRFSTSSNIFYYQQLYLYLNYFTYRDLIFLIPL